MTENLTHFINFSKLIHTSSLSLLPNLGICSILRAPIKWVRTITFKLMSDHTKLKSKASRTNRDIENLLKRIKAARQNPKILPPTPQIPQQEQDVKAIQTASQPASLGELETSYKEALRHEQEVNEHLRMELATLRAQLQKSKHDNMGLMSKLMLDSKDRRQVQSSYQLQHQQLPERVSALAKASEIIQSPAMNEGAQDELAQGDEKSLQQDPEVVKLRSVLSKCRDSQRELMRRLQDLEGVNEQLDKTSEELSRQEQINSTLRTLIDKEREQFKAQLDQLTKTAQLKDERIESTEIIVKQLQEALRKAIDSSEPSVTSSNLQALHTLSNRLDSERCRRQHEQQEFRMALQSAYKNWQNERAALLKQNTELKHLATELSVPKLPDLDPNDECIKKLQVLSEGLTNLFAIADEEEQSRAELAQKMVAMVIEVEQLRARIRELEGQAKRAQSTRSQPVLETVGIMKSNSQQKKVKKVSIQEPRKSAQDKKIESEPQNLESDVNALACQILSLESLPSLEVNPPCTPREQEQQTDPIMTLCAQQQTDTLTVDSQSLQTDPDVLAIRVSQLEDMMQKNSEQYVKIVQALNDEIQSLKNQT